MLQSSWLSQNKGYIHQLIVCCSVSILAFIYGLVETWPSLAIARILRGDAGFPVTKSEIATIVTMPLLAETLTPIFFGFIMARYGRKLNLLFNAAFFIVTWTLITFAASPIHLMVGSFASGIGYAISLIIGPIYIAEIADKNRRGALVSIYVTAISIGQIFLTSVGIYISYFTLNIISLIISISALFCIVVFAVETPYWYLMENDGKKAEKSFKYYWSSNSSHDETVEAQMSAALAELSASVTAEMASSSSYRELFGTPSNVRASFIIIVLSLFQGACGLMPIFTYASTTLPQYDGFWQPNPTIAVVSTLNLVTNFISVVLIDRLGRKPLTIISNIGDAVGTGLVTVYFFIEEYTSLDTTDIKWMPYIGVLVFISFYGFAMTTMPHLLASELFPANVRYHANVACVVCFAGVSCVFNYVYLDVCRWAGVSAMFGLFTACSLAGAIFSYVYVFETKNMSLAEIQAMATGKASKSRY